jgi:hypothetical protein
MSLHVKLRKLLVCLGLTAGVLAQAQPKAVPPPEGTDTLVFKDGEKLIGELIGATDTVLVFKSNIGFQVTVPWAKIDQVHSSMTFAAVRKGFTLRSPGDAAGVPVGKVDGTAQNVQVAAAPPVSIPVAEVANVVAEPAFKKDLERASVFAGWKGGVNFGLSLTQATISTRTVNGSLDLTRQDTSVAWLPLHNRTTLGLTVFNALTVSPGEANSKTSLIHADAVHDMYFRPRLFGFVGAQFDHNYNQGLDLLQGYGGGIGVVAFKNGVSEWDFRAGLGYMRQTYTDPALNANLIGSRFNQTYTRTFAHGITFFEMAGIRPAWNSMKNYYAGYQMSLDIPVYKRLSFNLSSFDSYVNNPPPYRKKNTLQVSAGLHITLFK